MLNNLALSQASRRRSRRRHRHLAAGDRPAGRLGADPAEPGLADGAQGRSGLAPSAWRARTCPPDVADNNNAYFRMISAAAKSCGRRRRRSRGPIRRLGGINRPTRRRAGRHFIQLGNLDPGRTGDHDEQHRQEEDDHRHGELCRKRRGFLLRGVQAGIAVFLGDDAQTGRDRRTVFFRLKQRGGQRAEGRQGRCARRDSHRPNGGRRDRRARPRSAPISSAMSGAAFRHFLRDLV